MTSLLCNICIKHLIALLNELALLALTNALMPLINIPPIAVVPCAIARNGVAFLFLKCDLSFLFLTVDVTGPLELSSILFGRSASKVTLIFHSNLL